jgi:hypothetical protein
MEARAIYATTYRASRVKTNGGVCVYVASRTISSGNRDSLVFSDTSPSRLPEERHDVNPTHELDYTDFAMAHDDIFRAMMKCSRIRLSPVPLKIDIRTGSIALSSPFCPLVNFLSPDQSGRWLVGAVGIEPA